MKKFLVLTSVIILLTNTAGCGKNTQKNENVYSAIHEKFYDLESYTAQCSVTAYTAGGSNTYGCTMSYRKPNNEFTIETDDMKLVICEDKTTISKGKNILETTSSESDMYMFVNSFFKSYYESESTSLITSGSSKRNSVLLECDVLNPASTTAHMKLTINTDTVLPEKMQIYDKSGFMNTEILFEKFEFENML